jgi:hypothetical protein
LPPKADIERIGLHWFFGGAPKIGRRTNALKTNLKTRRSKFAKPWSGRRESNPRMQLGKLPFYH